MCLVMATSSSVQIDAVFNETMLNVRNEQNMLQIRTISECQNCIAKLCAIVKFHNRLNAQDPKAPRDPRSIGWSMSLLSRFHCTGHVVNRVL